MEDRPKTGTFTGSYALHPFTNEPLPIWIADYVIGSYGTGAVMAVPAHDTRDHAFAKQYKLPIKWVIAPADADDSLDHEDTFTEYGIMHDSAEFDGMTSEEGMKAVGRKLEGMGQGRPTITWHLRDWTISRQRYWGCPIPIIHCEKCGAVPVPEKDLPILLPDEVDDYKPKGKSPLESVESFMKVSCPKCGGSARRDADTMDTFVCSSWYYMRYPDARLDSKPFDEGHLNHMLPIDQYVGGAEHAMGHLIYSRFFAKIAYDAGYLKTDEPYKRLVHQGTILNNGERMSKSRGNVVAPEAYLQRVGSDVLRCYLMFSGDYNQGGDWSDSGISGIERFIARVWRLTNCIALGERVEIPVESRDTETKLHQTIKHVSADLEHFSFNTSLARLMELTNHIYGLVGSDLKDVKRSPLAESSVEMLIRLIAPFAPHLADELWTVMGHSTTVFDEPWPKYDEAKAIEDTVTIAVQINGKLRDTFQAARDADKDGLIATAMESEKIKVYIEGQTIVKTIVVPNKIVNIVVR
jgi:leucyl-tRNA synthetase